VLSESAKRIAVVPGIRRYSTAGFAVEGGAMSLLTGLRVVQLGDGLAAAVCGRLFADTGAEVTCVGVDAATTPLALYLEHGKTIAAADVTIAAADLIVVEGGPAALRARRHDPECLRRLNPTAAIVTIAPFGQTGPKADTPTTDLTVLFASGIARMLTGQVDNLAEAPMRPVGEQSAFIGGVAAACAGMQAVMSAEPAIIDVSIEEALATLAVTELARAGLTGKSWPRKRIADGNGATVTILPARDGYVAISPRDEHQWKNWLKVIGSPEWGAEPRFATKSDRVANWDAVHALLSEWSRRYDKQQIADMAQEAHVPSFPLREPAEQLRSEQLEHRHFWSSCAIGQRTIKAPGPPFGLTLARGAGQKARIAGPMPLSGVRVLDFSWVIAGPTVTRYLAAAGADVVKVEAPGRGDPGRASELHTVLGQAKRSITLDLKKPLAVELARQLAAQSDVLVENFATGVMDRLGLGPEQLREVNPNLIYVSASGLGRTGPEARAVAYGTLLQCYAGFAGLNRHPRVAPRVGMAWLDPMCGLMLAFVVVAGLWRRRRDGAVARVDFSMLEGMLWTMAEPLLAAQLDGPPQPRGNDSPEYVPHGVYRCASSDDWLSVAVTSKDEWRRLCAAIPALEPLAGWDLQQRRGRKAGIDGVLMGWALRRTAAEAETELRAAGVPTAALNGSLDLVGSEHLRERGFWDAHGAGVLPGLPWRASFGRVTGSAPALGADTDAVLGQVLRLSSGEIDELRTAGAFG
jgi:crotonobetainyl-CoA:carnitine CoA-transferase CaiB-like acyl-CoA transferase